MSARAVYDERDRDDHDPRDGPMHDVDLPRGEERELVVNRDRAYELNGEDSRTLAAVGTFRVVPERDLDTDHDTLHHLRDEGLVDTVDRPWRRRTRPDPHQRGRDLLDSHTLEREDGSPQALHAGISRFREIDHDSSLYATYRQEEARLRDEHGDLEIRRVVLEQDMKREYQEFLQKPNRNQPDSDGRGRPSTSSRSRSATRTPAAPTPPPSPDSAPGANSGVSPSRNCSR